MKAIDQGALYYPYTRIPSVKWLTHTLLLFRQVQRIVPFGHKPGDANGVNLFEKQKGGAGPLLQRADLYSGHFPAAVEKLFAEFETLLTSDSKSFVEKFGRNEAESLLSSRSDPGFQIHGGKAAPVLRLLADHGLAWDPRAKEPVNPESFVQVHPTIGEVIMKTLAETIAQDHGLKIVTDSGPVHWSGRKTPKELFDRLIKREPKRASTKRDHDGGEDRKYKIAVTVIEDIIDEKCLTPKALADLSKNWDAREKFLKEIQGLCDSIPPVIRSKAVLQGEIEARAETALINWRKDMKGLRMFQPTAEGFKDFSKEFITSSFMAAGTAGMTGDILKAVSAFGITFVIQAFVETYTHRKNSPYRYLSLIEREAKHFTVTR